MKYRRLGQSDFEVSIISFGAWQLGDPEYWGPDAEADGAAAVAAAIDGGVNLFDTAEMYGDGASEEALGKALGAKRGEVLIASKFLPEHGSPEQIRASCEASLRRLGTDYIDLYQVHWPVRGTAFEEVYATLEALRDEGKIRAIGVSNYGREDLSAWLGLGDTVSNQLGYNMLFRAVEYDIVPLCRREKLGILCYMPLMQGLLAGRWNSVDAVPVLRRRTRHFSRDREGTRHSGPGCEDLLMETVAQLGRFCDAIGVPLATVSLCWCAAQPGVSSVIVGGRKPEQVHRNLEAGDLDLGPAAIAQLNEITGPLKHALGSNADMWLDGQEARIR